MYRNNTHIDDELKQPSAVVHTNCSFTIHPEVNGSYNDYNKQAIYSKKTVRKKLTLIILK